MSQAQCMVVMAAGTVNDLDQASMVLLVLNTGGLKIILGTLAAKL